jgi:hypothetical protein
MVRAGGNENVCCSKLCDTQELVDECKWRGVISGLKAVNSVMHKSGGNEKCIVINFVMHKGLSKNVSGGITRRLKDLNSAMHKSEGNEKVCLNPCDTQELVNEYEWRVVCSVIKKVYS